MLFKNDPKGESDIIKAATLIAAPLCEGLGDRVVSKKGASSPVKLARMLLPSVLLRVWAPAENLPWAITAEMWRAWPPPPRI